MDPCLGSPKFGHNKPCSGSQPNFRAQPVESASPRCGGMPGESVRAIPPRSLCLFRRTTLVTTWGAGDPLPEQKRPQWTPT